MNKFNVRLKIICCAVIAASLTLLFPVPHVASQENLHENFIGRGVAKIYDGDIAGARHGALVDSQEKVIMQSIAAQLPVEDIAKYFQTLHKIFLNNADAYIQRYKILNENALFDTYHVTIEGFVQQDALRYDLEMTKKLS